MRSLFFLFLVLFLVSGCFTSTDTDQHEAKLVVTDVHQGKAPLTVHLTGTLELADKRDKRFYCVMVDWDFGDGQHLGYIPGCLPWTEESMIQEKFVTQHTYEEAGKYAVLLRVGDLTSEHVDIVVGDERECSSDTDCFVGGCSGQLCSRDEEVITTCEWKEEYGCYTLSSCGCIDGKCEWKASDALDSCLDTFTNV